MKNYKKERMSYINMCINFIDWVKQIEMMIISNILRYFNIPIGIQGRETML